MKFQLLVLLSFFFLLLSCNNAKISEYTIKKTPTKVQTPHFKNKTTTPHTSITQKWKAPSHWVAQGKNGMRLETFLIKNKKGSAELSVINLSGQAGSILANVNRWRAQLSLPATTQENLKNELIHIVRNNQKSASYIELTATKKDIKQAQQESFLIGIINDHSGSTFYKLMGNKDVTNEEKENFKQFLKTVQ